MGRKSPTPLALSEVVRIVGADSAYLYLCLEGSERLFLKKAEGAEGREVDPGAASAVVVERVRLSRELHDTLLQSLNLFRSHWIGCGDMINLGYMLSGMRQ